jgi:hypothetical protein
VRGIRIAVDEADRDHLHARPHETLGRPHDAGLVQGSHDAAIGGDALVDLEPQPPRHQRARLLPGEVVKVGRPHPADLQHVAEAARGDEAGDGPGLLEDRVRRHRGAVDDLHHVTRRRAGGPQQRGEAVHHREARVVRRGRDLADTQRAVGQTQDDVGEGAADIDADAEGGGDGGGRHAVQCTIAWRRWRRAVAVAPPRSCRLVGAARPLTVVNPEVYAPEAVRRAR